MSYENTIHYAPNTSLGEIEWNYTLPRGGAVVHLGPDCRPFTVSMFHQLRCLNIVRAAIIKSHDGDPLDLQRRKLVDHCMNYLRQMILCRMDTTLEPLRAIHTRGVAVWDITHVCKDWSMVYKEAERNYNEFLSSL